MDAVNASKSRWVSNSVSVSDTIRRAASKAFCNIKLETVVPISVAARSIIAFASALVRRLIRADSLVRVVGMASSPKTDGFIVRHFYAHATIRLILGMPIGSFSAPLSDIDLLYLRAVRQ